MTMASVDLRVQTAIDNVRSQEIDFQLLESVLSHCTLEQLKRIEDSCEGKDISHVTNGPWKKFFERRFGTKNVDLVVARMEKEKVQCSWRQLYEAKVKDQEDKEQRLSARMREMYKIEEAKKRNRQIQLIRVTPTSISSKRGPQDSDSSTKKNIMKKAKVEFVSSLEVKNLSAMKIKVAQRTNEDSPVTRTSSQFPNVSSSETSRKTRPAAGKILKGF